jgi:hypothetical protein
VKVPEGWRVASLGQPASLQLRFSPSSGGAFSLQVTAAWLDADEDRALPMLAGAIHSR